MWLSRKTLVAGVTTFSIDSNTFMARGMPGGRHIQDGSVPIPPAFWSAVFQSKIAWYSVVSGALSPARTQTGRSPGGRTHLPFQSGYFASSNACADAASRHKPAARVMIATQPRYAMMVLIVVFLRFPDIT